MKAVGLAAYRYGSDSLTTEARLVVVARLVREPGRRLTRWHDCLLIRKAWKPYRSRSEWVSAQLLFDTQGLLVFDPSTDGTLLWCYLLVAS